MVKTFALVLLLALMGVIAFAASAEAAFPSTTNGKIAYVAFTPGAAVNFEVLVMNIDGTGATNLSNDPDDERDPAWSPDGSKIAFARAPFGTADIWVMNGDGTGLIQLTSGVAADRAPAWSPDAGKIAFERDGEIWAMNADGSSPVNLTNDPGGDLKPAWSPDGTRIAFTRAALSRIDIWVMNADGSGQTNLTGTSSETQWAPAWSPDGTKIALGVIYGATGERKQVDVVNADGTGRVTLINGATPEFFGAGDPAWSPDGTKISFTTDSEAGSISGQLDIWTANADGSGLINLTNTATENEFDPDWQQGNCAPGDWDCDGVAGLSEGQCGDAIDNDGNGLINDGCPQVDSTAETGGQCTNSTDDDGDGWVNDGCPGSTELVGCGSNALDPGSVPERVDTPGDDDGDTLVNEALPPGAEAYDCDGDGLAMGDNCTQAANVVQSDTDGDLAGDACDVPGSGNVDCSGPAVGVTSVDALKILRHNAGLSVSQNEPCLDIGLPRLLAAPADWQMGDVDCSGGVNSVDALKILRAVAGLAVAYVGVGCPEVKPP